MTNNPIPSLPEGPDDGALMPSSGLQDILGRSFIYSHMSFDGRGDRIFKMVIKTQTLKDLQDLRAALVDVSSSPPPQDKTQ